MRPVQERVGAVPILPDPRGQIDEHDPVTPRAIRPRAHGFDQRLVGGCGSPVHRPASAKVAQATHEEPAQDESRHCQGCHLTRANEPALDEPPGPLPDRGEPEGDQQRPGQGEQEVVS